MPMGRSIVGEHAPSGTTLKLVDHVQLYPGILQDGCRRVAGSAGGHFPLDTDIAGNRLKAFVCALDDLLYPMLLLGRCHVLGSEHRHEIGAADGVITLEYLVHDRGNLNAHFDRMPLRTASFGAAVVKPS